MNVYEYCPKFENKDYLIRLVKKEDISDLLKIYRDINSVPLFNSDNCHGDDFHYTTVERMTEAYNFWEMSYKNGYFVRWSIVSKAKNEVIRTIELFHRDEKDYFTNCGLLRLDLRSDYEKAPEIEAILSLIINHVFDLFDCNKIATKAIPEAKERIAALKALGFTATEEKLIGHDGTKYSSYYVYNKS